MANGSGGGPAVLGNILGGMTQANAILAAAVTLVTTYRAIRKAWQDANPGQQGDFVTDQQLIDLLQRDAAAGVSEVDAILAKHRPAEQEQERPAPRPHPIQLFSPDPEDPAAGVPYELPDDPIRDRH